MTSTSVRSRLEATLVRLYGSLGSDSALRSFCRCSLHVGQLGGLPFIFKAAPGATQLGSLLEFSVPTYMAAPRAVARALWGGECRGGAACECARMRGALAARSSGSDGILWR